MSDYPHRPEGPEFDRLAAIVSGYDERMDAAPDGDGKEQVFQDALNEVIPQRVLSYVAIQRAMRAVGTEQAWLPSVTRLASAWIDGFVAGAAYAKGANPGWDESSLTEGD